MSACKWTLCICLWAGWILGGLPDGVNAEVPTDDPKTVKECRVHIEKALEEYWDKAEPNTDATSSNRNLDSNPPLTNYDNKEENLCDGDRNCEKDLSQENPGKVDQITEPDDDDDDDDDDDNDNDDSTESLPSGSTQDAERGRDQQQSSNSDSLESETAESQIESPKVEEDGKLSDQSSSWEASEIKRVFVVKNLNKEPIEFDDLNSDNKGEEEDKAKDEEVKVGEVEDEGDEDDEDADDVKEDGNNVEGDDADDDDDDEGSENEDNAAVAIEEDTKVDDIDRGDGLNAEEDDDDDDEDDEEEELGQIPVDGSGTNASIATESSKSDSSSDQPEIQINTSKVVEEKEVPAPDIKPSVVTPPVVEPSKLATAAPEVSNLEETPAVEIKKGTGPELSAKEELIENIYEDEDDDDDEDGLTYRNRDHIDVILGLDEVGTELEKEEEQLAQSIFKDIKRIGLSHIRPMELLYKFADSTTRSLGDAEIFSKPMILFLGPWNSGKSSIINYILGIERTPSALQTGTGITDVGFTVLTHGPQRRVISGTELATDWRYSGVQKFGQGFLDHFKSIHIPHALLQKVTIVDTPGILENRKTSDRGYPLNDALQWFIDRADAVYVVLDPNKVDIGGELGAVIDQLKGRDARFVLNKADSVRRSDLMRVVGQLFWNLSPLMSGSDAPIIYAVSLTSHPYHPSAPARFLDDQEKNLFYDMRATLEKRVETRILYARRHAVRVRNHAKTVDCYLATFYRHKSIFSNKRNVAKQIVDNPRDYSIYDGIVGMSNVSRYDLPDPVAYRDFFRTHPLYDFKPLASTCSYFRGCPMEKLDEAIAKDIPELLARYKKAKNTMQSVVEEEPKK